MTYISQLNYDVNEVNGVGRAFRAYRESQRVKNIDIGKFYLLSISIKNRKHYIFTIQAFKKHAMNLLLLLDENLQPNMLAPKYQEKLITCLIMINKVKGGKKI